MTRRICRIFSLPHAASSLSLQGASEAVFLADEILPAAVLHHLTVIGEAISRLSDHLKERHPEVPWKKIVGVRHRIVHAYFDLDWQILWDAAVADVPELRRRILDIAASEFPESNTK